MLFPHSTLTATEPTWDFNEACTHMMICLDRDEFHAYIEAAGLNGSSYPITTWYRYWEWFVVEEMARDEADTIADTLAARHW